MDEVNELPQGWKWVKLGDVCHIEMGQSPNGDSYNKNKNGLPLLNGPAEFGKLNPTPVQWTTESTKLAEKGDILFCVRGSTTGRKNIADRCYCIGRGIASIRGVINKSDTTFLYLLLDQITEELLLKTSGSTFPNLSGENLKKFEIPFPELPEQQRLATLLTAKLALIEQAKEKITAQLQAAQELTVAYLREVFESEEAKGWEWVKLEDVCDIKGGKRLPNGTDFSKQKTDYPYIRVTDFLKGSVRTDNLKYIDDDTRKKISRYIIQKENVYISIAGSIGLVGIIPEVLHNASLTENAARLIIKNESILNRDFLSNFLGSDLGQEKIRLRTNTVGQPKLALTRIATIEIPLPPPDKQTQLANYLSEKLATVEQLKTTLQTQLDSINQLPAALLKQAFKGEL
ncbi:MAG: restriction endonuclease subunit S [Methylococcales bacterium]